MNSMQYTLTAEAALGAIIALCICVVFARAYAKGKEEVARVLAVIFGGLSFYLFANMLSLLINENEACFRPAYYYIRIVGTTTLCASSMYGGFKLLFLKAV